MKSRMAGWRLNRRNFLRMTGYLLFLPLIYLTGRTLKQKEALQGAREWHLPMPAQGEVAFHGPVILINEGSDKSVRAYASACTHLGCRIERLENNLLICPCHGSRYDLDGKPVQGPAVKSLQSLPLEVMEDTLTVNVTV